MAQVLTAAQAEAAWGPGCKPRGLTTVKVDGLLFSWIKHDGAVKALEALSSVLVRHDYEVRAIDTGTYNCRFISGTSTLSRHAKPTAIDINWKTNPDGSRLITDMPRAMVNEIVALRTVSGEQVWRWGGDWDTRPETPHGYYDAMHFELIAHPDDLDTGIEDMALSAEVEEFVNMLYEKQLATKTFSKDIITRDELNEALAGVDAGNDPVARKAAAAAQAAADRANTDLAQIKAVIG